MAYFLATAIVAGTTVTPLPFPPAWLILAYLSVELGASVPGIVLAGALGATLGRCGLVLWTRYLGLRLLGPATRANVDYLAARLRGQRTRLGTGALLAVSPPPAGALYAAAGVLRISIALVAGACLLGRLVTYSLGVSLADAAAGELADRLRDAASPWLLAPAAALVVVLLALLARVDWRALLERRRLRLRPRTPRGMRSQ